MWVVASARTNLLIVARLRQLLSALDNSQVRKS